jgi:hypothetical protein
VGDELDLLSNYLILRDRRFREREAMLHRHLNHEHYTLAALDDLIGRGKREDWAQLRSVALADRNLMEKILRIALAHAGDPYAQRYHFWRQYAEQHLKVA